MISLNSTFNKIETHSPSYLLAKFCLTTITLFYKMPQKIKERFKILPRFRNNLSLCGFVEFSLSLYSCLEFSYFFWKNKSFLHTFFLFLIKEKYKYEFAALKNYFKKLIIFRNNKKIYVLPPPLLNKSYFRKGK